MRWSLSLAVLAFAGAAPAAAQEVTFTKDIAPILYKNCAGCHRPGEVGPFPLLTYKDVAKRARHIKEVTASRRMPIWKPVPGWGEFHGERRLSDQDIALLGAWADSGAKEGNPADLPPLPKFPEGWLLGEPDVVFKMPQPFEVPAGGGDVYRCFVIPANLPEDHSVAGFEFRGGNRKVVHHAACFIVKTGVGRELEGKDGKTGFASFGTPGVPTQGRIGGWVPGSKPHFLPEGVGHKLPKGADLLLWVHYHPDGKPETDQSTVALYFAKKPVTRRIIPDMLIGKQISIPAGEKRYRREDSLTLPANVQLLAIGPHMHLIGREMKVTATLPDGTIKPLIWIKDWDFNWQGFYVYREKVALPKGTTLHMEAFYDNSADNPQNPNHPPRRVWRGIASTDEMCECLLQMMAADPNDERILLKAIAQRFRNAKQNPQQ